MSLLCLRPSKASQFIQNKIQHRSYNDLQGPTSFPPHTKQILNWGKGSDGWAASLSFGEESPKVLDFWTDSALDGTQTWAWVLLSVGFWSHWQERHMSSNMRKRFDHWRGRDKHQVSREYQKEAPNLVCGKIRLGNHQFYLNLILSPAIFIMNKIKENRFIFLLINE